MVLTNPNTVMYLLPLIIMVLLTSCTSTQGSSTVESKVTCATDVENIYKCPAHDDNEVEINVHYEF